MAGWIGVITNAGASLLAEWVQGSVLSIDSAEAGTGTYPDSTLMAKTALAEYKQATGFEAVIGYLYLKKDQKRLEEIVNVLYELGDNSEI